MSTESTIKLSWRCMCFVGPCKWQTLDDYEPDECDTEFETEDARENWDAICCTATCPRCKADLTQKFDEPTLIL